MYYIQQSKHIPGMLFNFQYIPEELALVASRTSHFKFKFVLAFILPLKMISFTKSPFVNETLKIQGKENA